MNSPFITCIYRAEAAEVETKPEQSKEHARVTDKVYFDLTLDGQAAGRVVIGLYGDVVPRTNLNFQSLGRSHTLQALGCPKASDLCAMIVSSEI